MGSNRYHHEWTDKEMATLRRCWAEGLAVSAIVKQLGAGITRNSAIGKARRLELGDHPDITRPTQQNHKRRPFRIKGHVTKQRRGVEAAQRTAELRSMDSLERQKLIRILDVPFLYRRLDGEPTDLTRPWR